MVEPPLKSAPICNYRLVAAGAVGFLTFFHQEQTSSLLQILQQQSSRSKLDRRLVRVSCSFAVQTVQPLHWDSSAYDGEFTYDWRQRPPKHRNAAAGTGPRGFRGSARQRVASIDRSCWCRHSRQGDTTIRNE